MSGNKEELMTDQTELIDQINELFAKYEIEDKDAKQIWTLIYELVEVEFELDEFENDDQEE